MLCSGVSQATVFTENAVWHTLEKNGDRGQAALLSHPKAEGRGVEPRNRVSAAVNAKGVRLRFFPPSWLDWGGGAGFLLLDDN